MKRRLFVTLSFSFSLNLLLGACSPKVYVIDRQTVLEEEAAGEWPEFEKSLLEQAADYQPTPFPKTAISQGRNRLYNVINGQLVRGELVSNALEGAGVSKEGDGAGVGTETAHGVRKQGAAK